MKIGLDQGDLSLGLGAPEGIVRERDIVLEIGQGGARVAVEALEQAALQIWLGPLGVDRDRAAHVGDAGGMLVQLAPADQAAAVVAARERRPQPQRPVERADAGAKERLVGGTNAPIA